MVKLTKYSLKGKSRSSYMDLVLEFPLASIKSARHLSAAQTVMDRLLAKSKLDAGEQTYLEALSDLAEAYEDLHIPVAPPSDADMLRHLLDSRGINAIQLSRDTGIAKSTISEILTAKKSFSRQIIRKLSDYFHIEVGVLASNI